ncbi:MAG TPA: ABA4-like family protein [Anaerolineae bacterium]|nr:DUF4281 domain-containing protein [Anaerolineae bacterium]HRV91936.1 ABA4-like family protein [Anaerolineae bacterium]
MDNFFIYLNLFPMPLWLAMMFAPRHPVTERMGRSSTIFGLGALHYVIAIIIALKHGPQERKQAGQIQTVNVTTLDGIRELLSIRSGTLAAWAHMLALDLFTGGWIYRQSRQLNAPDWVRIGSLLFTLMMGPLGLLVFLLWRMFGRKTGEAL